MELDWLSIAALVVVVALYVVIYVLRSKKQLNFTFTILGALLAGVVVGVIFAGHTDWIIPFGKIYVTVLSAIVMPLIAVSILSAVTSLGSVKQLRGIGARSVGWLLGTNLIAIVLALGLGLAFGVGEHADLSIEGVDAANFEAATPSALSIIVGFFPRNIVDDLASDHIIPVILFCVLIAVSYVLVAHQEGAKVRVFKDLVEATKAVIFKAVTFIIELTPYAVLSLVAVQASRGLENTGIIWSLLVFLLVAFLAFIIDTWVLNGVLLSVFTNVNIFKFFRRIVPAQVIGFSTQSSVGTLPVTTRILTEEIGVSPSVANFTAPLGTTIGMPGCAGIWPILTAIYGINGLGINYSLKDYLLLVVIGLFVSIGVAGVPGTATVVTASVLTAVGLPLEVMVLTIPISSIADTGRTATNITGAMVAATIVAYEEKELNVSPPDADGEPLDEAADAADAEAFPEALTGESCPI
ncbi:MAG: dicarboxylate/amino acid:cation symporter [Propionibacteriaceae bacterium]|jgi:Na+/H+-dicarboxylate symporter|nr:dicarboxylate/amino acid:cation symporter [Propionibacteriaceae bacterium]